VSPREVPDDITHGHGISRTLAALEVLAEGSITAAALGERIAVDTRTARRLLQRLAVDGYLARGHTTSTATHPRRHSASSARG
jgi:predicted ArsR family transcriptional regulator